MCIRDRLITVAAESERWSLGFRFTCMRPVLSVVLEPSTPTIEERLSTAGSFRISDARACWRSTIAS